MTGDTTYPDIIWLVTVQVALEQVCVGDSSLHSVLECFENIFTFQQPHPPVM